jgi:hypothetical protein
MERAIPGQETLMPNDKEFELDDLESFSFDDLSLDEAPAAAETPGEDPMGVYVKSAPEDLDAAPEAAAAEPVSDGLPEEDFLSTEELANLDDSFEFVTVEEPLAGEDPLEAEAALEDEVAFLDTPEAIEAEKSDASASLPAFDEISLDDFVSFDDAAPSESPASVASSPTFEAPPADDDFSEEFLDIDIDIDDDIGDDELEIVPGAQPKADDLSLEADDFAAQEVDLAEFGDFEEVTPVATPLGEGEDLPEVKDLPEIAALDDDPFLGEDDGYFEEEVFDEPMAALIDEGPVSLDLEPDDHTDMEHILALEEDLTSGIRKKDETAPAGDAAAAILGKIEQELSSIKQEISDLKREVTHLRTQPVPAAASAAFAPATESLETSPEEAPKSHGFFDEEDDETIALTGDELDNILSTAEISEGEEPGVIPDEDLLGLDAEGNLLDLPATEEVHAPDEVYVTDEEFLAGTALADAETAAGVPDSIELEESLPLELDGGETEDLLSDADLDFDVGPLPDGVLQSAPDPLELPSDEDLGLELADVGSLAPDLIEETETFSDELTLDTLEPDLDPSEGWSPSPSEPLPTPPTVTQSPGAPPTAPQGSAPAAVPSSGSNMSAGLKDELRAVLSYMDKLLASLPDDKIQEFAESEHFEVYKRLFEELGLIE